MGFKINKNTKLAKCSFFTQEQEIWIYDWLFQHLEIESFSNAFDYKRTLHYISNGSDTHHLNICLLYFAEAFPNDITNNQYNELKEIFINYAKDKLKK